VLDLPEPDRASFADLGRTRIRLWEWGDPSDPPALLVHGGWDHGRMWDGLAPRLAALGRHAVAIDLRGHGDSGAFHDGGFSFSAFVLDLAQVARRLGPPVLLVGHSLGGGVVLSAASGFPELVEAIVNIDGLGPPPELMLVEDHAASAAQWLGDAERLWQGSPREYASIEEMAEKRKGINTRLPYEWCLHMATHGTKRGPGGGFTWKADARNRLGSPGPFAEDLLLAQYALIERPVMVLTGTEPDQWSFLTDEDKQRRLAVFPDVQHHVVAGAGHYVHVEQPDATIELIERFVAS
jgi:pimeloyl-ACP methyl ester carboxylesterase